MLTVLFLIVIAFFGSAIIYGLIEGIKEGFGMTNEDAKKILEEDQRRKDTERIEQKELHKSLDNEYDEDGNEYGEDDEEDDEDDEEDDDEDDEDDDDDDEEEEEEEDDEEDDEDIDDILYGYLDEQLDKYERYGIGPDPDDKYTFGGYVNPELHERKEQREFKKWLKSQK